MAINWPVCGLDNGHVYDLSLQIPSAVPRCLTHQSFKRRIDPCVRLQIAGLIYD